MARPDLGLVIFLKIFWSSNIVNALTHRHLVRSPQKKIFPRLFFNEEEELIGFEIRFHHVSTLFYF